MRKRNSEGKFIEGKKITVLCSLCGKPKKISPSGFIEKNFFCDHKCHNEFRRGKKVDIEVSPEEKQRRKKRMELLWDQDRDNQIKKIKKGMQSSEVMEKVKKLNARKRKPLSEQHKRKISDKLVGKMPDNMEVYRMASCVRSKHGDISFGRGRTFRMRSTWERNVSRYFEILMKRGEIKNWEYEPQRFFFEGVNFGHRTYLPDFRITENNGYTYYVEVKGYMDKGSKVKLKRMKKYFPETEVQIIDKERYADISKIAPIIKEWEYDQTSKRVQYYVKKGWM